MPQERDDEKPLTQKMLELVKSHPRYDYRRIWALLQSEGSRSTANGRIDFGGGEG